MPKRIMPLTDIKIKTAKSTDKDVKLFDGGGLFLLITPTGGKLWRLKYRFDGKEKLLTFGAYPEVTLSVARQRRDEARTVLSNGFDPAMIRKEQKAANIKEAETFECIAKEWHDKFSPAWSKQYRESTLNRLATHIFPWIGNRSISAINAPDILNVLRKIEAKGTIETAHRMQQVCGQVFRYAIATGRAERNPCADLRGAIPPAPTKHMATITDPKEIAALLRSIDSYSGTFVVCCAFRFSPLVFCRPGEVRHAEWSEINFEAAEWRIPGEKMKMKGTHIVPLSKQALEILREIHQVTSTGKYVFPSARSASRAMSENAINAALKRMGYTGDDIVPHGFRGMASTILNEQGWNRDAIERQLAHAERDGVRAAYNHAEHLADRRKMMQAWADYLDELKAVAEIIPIKAANG